MPEHEEAAPGRAHQGEVAKALGVGEEALEDVDLARAGTAAPGVGPGSRCAASPANASRTWYQYWKAPRYTAPKRQNTMFLLQSTSERGFRSMAHWATRSAADVLQVAISTLLVKGYALAKPT